MSLTRGPLLIAGGGIGGLTAAIALRRAGFDAQVYERAPEIREVGAGITLQANAILALRTIGLDSAMIAAGRVATKASLQTAAGKVLSRIDLQGVERSMGAPAVAIHRATLQDVLVSALGGACQAIEDAVILADCLRQTPDPVAALRDYEARRRPRANGFVRASLRMGRFAQADSAAGCWLRNALVSLVPTALSRRQLLRTLR
jgi:2-polyprenyl-6-methoxyphenol hydroxylase-like FAD-dependent oxidoreductase